MIINLTTWEWPQYTIVSFWILDIIMNIIYHGKPRNMNYNAIGRIIGLVIAAYILTKGGFFH